MIVHANGEDHIVDMKDGWCYTHRNFCNLAENEDES